METFGTGELIYPEGETGWYLTYSAEHNYVISSAFTAGIPEEVSPAVSMPLRATADANLKVAGEGNRDGRDYAGQVTVTIGDKDYILIGNYQQLEALNYGSDSVEVYGPIMKVHQTRPALGGVDDWDTAWEEIYYPGDADLAANQTIYDGNNGSNGDYHKLGTVIDWGTDLDGTIERDVYCAKGSDGSYMSGNDFITDNPYKDYKYSRTGNYIVFRDINMSQSSRDSWTPLMFSGTMCGVKLQDNNSTGNLWNEAHDSLNDTEEGTRPIISNVKVAPDTKGGKLNVSVQMGVGFFGTISGYMDYTGFVTRNTKVRNICISGATVENPCTECEVDQTLVSGLLSTVGSALGLVLDGLLSLLLDDGTIDGVDVRSPLTAMLNARAADPTSLATGAFVGRIDGDVTIEKCKVVNCTVKTKQTEFEKSSNGKEGKIVGVGGFVGSSQGEFEYDKLSTLLGDVPTVLADVLNVIPGLGLGDLITILLDNTVNLGSLIPVGYHQPTITDCDVVNNTFQLYSNEGRMGYGGFAGSLCGTMADNCQVQSSTLTIKAENFGGGFAGVVRDDIIVQTLSGLNITVGSWYPQSIVMNSSVNNSTINISGKDCLGGFIGIQANSIVMVDAIDEDSSLNITTTGDCIGGFTGKAQLGSLTYVTDYLKDDNSVTDVLQGVVSALDGSDSQRLLDMGVVSRSGIYGVEVNCPVSLITTGDKVGGLVGSGEGVYISRSSRANIKVMTKYDDDDAVVPTVTDRINKVERIVNVKGKDFAGGAAGCLKSANISSLLNNTLGLKSTEAFHLSDLSLNAENEGYSVDATGDYAGGAIGFAIGGDVLNVTANNLASVTAGNSHAGGFVGTTGPDKLTGEKGLNLSLLGLDLITLSNVLQLTNGIHTNYTDCSVNGIEAGFTVEAKGKRQGDDDHTDYTAGGFAADTTSVTMERCTVTNLLKVQADDHDGKAGGFVGYSSAGSLNGVTKDDNPSSLLDVNQILQLEADIIPSYNNCEVTYVNGGFVQANAAGGYTGEFRSGAVNTKITAPAEADRYVVHNIDHVLGGTYAGGFGGNVYSGGLLRDGGGGLSLLADNVSLDIDGLADITEAYVPIIKYAGVDSPNGFSVLAAYVETEGTPSTAGFAGGYIGYGSGIEVSYSHVNKLRNGTVTPPANLEEKDGSAYMDFTPTVSGIPYAVAGSRYAGGYIGYMNVGSATELGDGLKVLGDSLRLNDVLKGLNVVTSTIEHSNVYGCPGGYSVLASSHVNLGDSQFDEAGVGYAGGFAGKMLGAHIQDSNAENFAYIIGEIAAGGYAGEMLPGDVADLLNPEDGGTLSDLLGLVLETDAQSLSLVQAFVPTVYNSRTTCIPCGGAVRAQSFTTQYIQDGNQLAVRRGFAGGFVGHGASAQIWGSSNAAWKNENKYTGPKRDCDAIRIRSVYGAEYAGGYVGLLESGSTAQGGNLSLLGGLISADNLVGALNVVYPTIENANVYGPLEKTVVKTWNGWIDHVAKYGGFAYEIAKVGSFPETPEGQARLDEAIQQFIYGYHVVAGRDEYQPGEGTSLCGCAGGFAGAMYSGVIRYGTANNAKQVRAMRAAGGFAGVMQTKGLVDFGGVNLLGINLNLGQTLDVANVLVPVVFESGVTGYQNGLIVRAEGMPTYDRTTQEGNNQSVTTVDTDCGMAGGFVGACYGGQIANRADGRINFKDQDPDNGAWVRNLKTVTGTNDIGGFVGKTSAASIANVDDSETSNGLVQGLLDNLLSNPSDLVDVLGATITVIGKAEVTAANPEWGIVVDGEYLNSENKTKYASCAGGFVGLAEATVFGNRSLEERTLTLTGLRGVSGGHYTGGFFGLGQVGSVAEVGSSNSETSVLGLIQAGNVSILDIFRTYIYHATVNCEWVKSENSNTAPELVVAGPEDGLRIVAHDVSSTGSASTYQESGAAGGFGGGLMNGTVENSYVSDINYVQSPNYSAGFIGICSTSSGISVDSAKVKETETNSEESRPTDSLGNLVSSLGLNLDTNPELLNVIGATVTDCAAEGFANGFIARTTNIQVVKEDIVTLPDLKGSCAAGFIGFADMTHIENCRVTGFKYAMSPQIAGGFVGRTGMNYLLDVDINSDLTGVVVNVVNALVRALYLKEAQQADVISLDGDYAGLKLMSDGDLLYVNLLGLKIGASLCKEDQEYQSDAVIVTVGSSTIKLPCDEDGLKKDENGNYPDISITLIEGNRTDIKNSFVKGIDDGYNVYAGGANDYHDGTDSLGYAGGFIGYNDKGMVTDCYTELCDVIRGTPTEEGQPSMVGPFIGYTLSNSNSTIGVDTLEGESNQFSIYRTDNGGYTKADTAEGTTFGTLAKKTNGGENNQTEEIQKVTVYGEECNRYLVNHRAVIKKHDDLKAAVETGGTEEDRLLAAYDSPAMEVLMLNVPLDDNGVGDVPITTELKDPCDTEIDITINKIWKDFIYLESRPDEIHITVSKVLAEVTDPDNPTAPEQLVSYGSTEGLTVVGTSELTLKNTEGSVWTSTWQAILPHQSVGFRDDNGKPTYYRYVISEIEIDNYRVTYEFDQDSATANIINRYKGRIIPLTGGAGVLMFYAVGSFLLVSGVMLLLLRRKTGAKKSAGEPVHADVELDLSNFSDFIKYLKN